MSFKTSSLFARAKSFSRTFWALPAFFILSLVPWLVTAQTFVLSRRFYDAGSDSLGLAFKIGAIGIAAFTALATLWFFVVWLWLLVRCIRGLETR